jgi:glucokinase
MTPDFIGGIDIGGTKISVGIAKPHEKLIASDSFLNGENDSAEQTILKALAALTTLAKRAKGRLTAIGIGCPGPLDFEAGKFLAPPNLPASWHHFPIRQFVEEKTELRVVIENDANAAAVGEHLFGAGRGYTDLVYLTISTGIGGGIIADNKLAHRWGEAGHITVLPDGEPCGCGARGCLEAVCSGSGIARRARNYLNSSRLNSGRPSLMPEMAGGVSKVTAKTVIDAVRANDELAKCVWDETIKFMAIGIGGMIAVLAPQAVILGGGVAVGAGEVLLKPLREELKQRLRITEPSPVMLASLGSESVLYGALALASREYFVSSLIPPAASTDEGKTTERREGNR